MVEVKLTLNEPKTGKSYTKVIDSVDNPLKGKKIGDKITLDDLHGFEFEIRGGSDSSGFPMRKDVPDLNKKRICSTASVGLKIKGRGIKRRKTVASTTIIEKTAQVNLKIIKSGSQNLEELFPKKEAKS